VTTKTTYSDFSGYLLRPQLSSIRSRKLDCDTSTHMGPYMFGLPVISANMRHITGQKMCLAMAECGGLGILPRTKRTDKDVEEFLETVSLLEVERSPSRHVGVSVGVDDGEKNRFDYLYQAGARLFCIDVAHGHHTLVRDMLQWIRRSYPVDAFVIAGNIATSEAAQDLQEWGANALKVGIGPGAACQTRQNTGVGVPQVKALMEVVSVSKVPVISDGGVREYGDVAKALACGADTVMVGLLLAGTIETPGSVFEDEEGNFYKVYGGSASGENKVESGESNSFVEGALKMVPFRGHVRFILKGIREGLQSAMSYSGAKDIMQFHAKARLEKSEE